MNYKSGLRIFIWPLEVPFFLVQKWALLAKVPIFGSPRDDLTVKAKNLLLPPVTLRSLTSPLARDERQRISPGLPAIKSRL